MLQSPQIFERKKKMMNFKRVLGVFLAIALLAFGGFKAADATTQYPLTIFKRTIVPVANGGTGAATLAGAGVFKSLSATAAIDFPAITPGTTLDSSQITLAGALPNDSVTVGYPATPTANVVFNAYVVPAGGAVIVRADNTSSAAVNPASATYRVTVTH